MSVPATEEENSEKIQEETGEESIPDDSETYSVVIQIRGKDRKEKEEMEEVIRSIVSDAGMDVVSVASCVV